MILRYDGSLAGFLCLAGQALKQRLQVTEIQRNQLPSSDDLFNRVEEVVTDRTWAAHVAAGLETRLGKRFMTTVAQALFSEEERIELALLQLLGRSLREGNELLQRLADPLVNRIDRAALRTLRERHRLLGLLRFSQLTDTSYLARVEPQTNVVPLLGSHFSKRLQGQRWLIIDMRRRLGVWGEEKRWELVEGIALPASLPQAEEDEKIVELWRCFYRNISNRQRHNPKLRQQFMPKRYWSYLTEMQANPET